VKKFEKMIADLKPRERKLLKTTKSFTVVDFENRGGVIMPLLVELHLEGGKTQEEVIAAEIWKLDTQRVSKLFVTTKPVTKVVIDPLKQTADVNTNNNVWPPEVKEETFTLTPENKSFDNPMKQDRANKEREAREKAEKAKAAKAKKEAEKKAVEKK
jgi:hypothetical protein